MAAQPRRYRWWAPPAGALGTFRRTATASVPNTPSPACTKNSGTGGGGGGEGGSGEGEGGEGGAGGGLRRLCANFNSFRKAAVSVRGACGGWGEVAGTLVGRGWLGWQQRLGAGSRAFC